MSVPTIYIFLNMKITFLGTRGYLKVKTKKHAKHTSTLITYKRKRILIDCGLDWLSHVNYAKPDAIILTHAHPDHAWGLQAGAPCPVYATKESWKILESYPIKDKKVVPIHKSFKIEDVTFEAFNEAHSIRCPAVGYRITAGKVTIFYSGDVLYIEEREVALADIGLYVGDAASVHIPMVRRRGDQLFGHAKIQTQLSWCQKAQVPRAIFTHCGNEIVESSSRKVNAYIKKLGASYDVDALIAHDGMSVTLR